MLACPLYWQPTVEERELAAKPETFGNAAAEVIPLAQTPANSLVFVGMTPCRLVDTRSGSGFTGGFGPPSLVAYATRSFPLQSSTTCSIPAIAQAYSLNVTVVPPGFLGYLTIWPYGAAQPLASTLNDSLGTVVANAAIVSAGNDTSKSVEVFVDGPTDLIIDINGYYAAQSGITLAQGSAGAPSLSFSGDAGTGIYSSGTGTVNISATKIEVSGDAQVDGGSILASGGIPVIQFPSNGSINFSAGLGALPPTTTGFADTALGYSALSADTTGYSNTAIGASALQSNATGDNNTASGYSALENNIAGSNNTAVGAFALNNTVGDNNIAIGYNAGISITTTNGNIDIGSIGVAGDSGVTRIGSAQNSVYIVGIQEAGVSGAQVLISSNGQLGVALSSRRYKEDIQDMGDASSGLMSLRPVAFRYKKAFSDGSQPIQYGLIAEEVADVYPELVARSEDGQIETVKYQELGPMLLNEIQKQNILIAAQANRIQMQEGQIRSLEQRLSEVERTQSRISVAPSPCR